MLSDQYVNAAKSAMAAALPPGRTAVVIGSDVNIYELAGEEAVALRLAGKI